MLTSPRSRTAAPHGPRLMARNARILELAVRHPDPRPTTALRGAHRVAPRMKPL
ncbi:hypothetical protein [Streptomyces sp. NPDC004270]